MAEEFLLLKVPSKLKREPATENCIKLDHPRSVIYRVTEEGLLDRLSTGMPESCLHVGKECRVLTVHGSADEAVPVEDAFEFSKIIANHKLHVIEGANHCYTSHHLSW